jgi:predicted Fe-Mo cluster-binding NifX family protein
VDANEDGNMKAAFARWEDRIAPVFDTAHRLLVIEIEAGKIVREMEETVVEELFVQRALRLVELGIGTLVCGAVSRPLHELVSAYGIEVIPFVAGGLRQVIAAWVSGRLGHGAFAMPGCRSRARKRSMGNYGDYQEVRPMQGQAQGPGQGAQGRGRRGGSMAAGVGGACVCPQCGQSVPHERGVPCVEQMCPKCGIAMTRK